jgi:hypothetical protein
MYNSLFDFMEENLEENQKTIDALKDYYENELKVNGISKEKKELIKKKIKILKDFRLVINEMDYKEKQKK